MDIGEKITLLRNEKGWSQGFLAKKAGLQQGQISQIESGKKKYPTARTLQKLCDALDISMSEFDLESNKEEAVELLPHVLEKLDSMYLTGNEQVAYNKIREMSNEEKEYSFVRTFEKFNKLSDEDKKAITTIINSLASTPDR